LGVPACGDAAAQSNQAVRLARAGRQRLTADWRELAAVVPIGEFGCGGPGRAGGHVLVTMAGVSGGGGERVVAELGQDVMGLAEDLAGLGQAGALAVLAVLDRGVVGVVGGRGPGVGLAGLIDRPAQHRRSLPGQPPGRALAVGGGDGDVQPGEPDRLAGGGEPARPAQPAGDRQGR